MNSEIKKPSECSKQEVENFFDLVKKGDEVQTHGLKGLIDKAIFLAFHYEKSALVGVVGLKQPNKSYKDKIFRKAGVPQESDNYDYEIGWAFTEIEYRGHRICPNLVDKLISKSPSQNIYATTKNESMKKILKRKGFKKNGHKYNGKRGDYFLELFTL